jgi:ABC-2 type transport system ATP-binding protein
MNSIETHSLSYSFGRKKVLDQIDLLVPKESVFGFLGPNGSGKTTTIRALLGLAKAPRGSVFLFGHDIRDHRIKILKNVGSLVEYPALYTHLTGYDNLVLHALLTRTRKTRINEVLKLVGLIDDAQQKVRSYSLGMKQRLGIACALLSDPDVLILDEPTNGLDPAGIRDIRLLIKALNQNFGKTFFISSHLLHEVELSCSHLAIIREGKIIYQGTTRQFKTQHTQTLTLETSDNQHAVELISESFTPSVTGECIQVTITSKNDSARIARTLNDHSIDVYRLEPSRKNLEELFITLTTK